MALYSLPRPFVDKLEEAIKQWHAEGKGFGCSCYYCEATPFDLVERGDVIPLIYCGDEKKIEMHCFRCSETAFYGTNNKFIKSFKKQEECLKAFRAGGGSKDDMMKFFMMHNRGRLRVHVLERCPFLLLMLRNLKRFCLHLNWLLRKR